MKKYREENKKYFNDFLQETINFINNKFFSFNELMENNDINEMEIMTANLQKNNVLT